MLYANSLWPRGIELCYEVRKSNASVLRLDAVACLYRQCLGAKGTVSLWCREPGLRHKDHHEPAAEASGRQHLLGAKPDHNRCPHAPASDQGSVRDWTNGN